MVVIEVLFLKNLVNLDQLHGFLVFSVFSFSNSRKVTILLKLNPDLHLEKQMDPDLQKMKADPQPWAEPSCYLLAIFFNTVVLY